MRTALPPPVYPVDLGTFAKVFRVTRLTARFLAPAAFDGGPSLPGRVRGAWGRTLADRAASGDALAETARAALFGAESADQKPFGLAAEDEGETIVVNLSLFGTADHYHRAAFDALIDGLSGGEGLALRNGPHAPRRALRLLGADWRRQEGVSDYAVNGAARLVFRTPFKIGPRDTLGATYSDIWVAAAMRASAIARWSGLALPAEVGTVRALANAMRYDASALRPQRWDRWSSRKPGLRHAMMGMEGVLTIDGWREELTPLLHLGQALHVGANVSFGLGRFEIG